MFKNKDYSFLSKLLHHLALGNKYIPEFLHDIELMTFKKKIEINDLKPHIFVCGLPRSGTTILMKTLYETNEFASLTYRDMPFVVLPNIWSKISNKIKANKLKERIHEDSISINIDSPEALEEVFWKTKLQKKYILLNKLISHEVDEFTINEFKNYISLILLKYKKQLYLSKNNNNILRIESIIKTFPNSLILIPYRDPLQQTRSLLTQHQRFNHEQKRNKFIKQYMTYLAHHEFGLDHKPYYFNINDKLTSDTHSIDYWLEQWTEVYTYLSQKRFLQTKNVLYINYENFCNNPESIFQEIKKRTNLQNLKLYNKNFKLSFKDINLKDKEKAKNAYSIYNLLKEKSIYI